MINLVDFRQVSAAKSNICVTKTKNKKQQYQQYQMHPSLCKYLVPVLIYSLISKSIKTKAYTSNFLIVNYRINSVRRLRRGIAEISITHVRVVFKWFSRLLGDWLKNLAPVFKPMKSKSNRTWWTRFFPLFELVTRTSWEFWLVHCAVCFCRNKFGIGFSKVIWKLL